MPERIIGGWEKRGRTRASNGDITHCANNNFNPTARFLPSPATIFRNSPNILVSVSAAAPVIFHVSFSALRAGGITNGADLTVMYNAQIYSIPLSDTAICPKPRSPPPPLSIPLLPARSFALSHELRVRPQKMQRTLTSAASNIPYGGVRHFLREIGRSWFFLSFFLPYTS